MTLYCIHKPYVFAMPQVIYKKDSTVEIPGVIRCERCDSSWGDADPEPKVAIGTIE